MILLFREKERLHKREELWVKVETLASKSPGFDVLVKQRQSVEYNNIANSPEEDGEVIIENIENEAQEVIF